MTSRDLIHAAINHQNPARVPVDLGATSSSGISIVAYQNLLKRLGKTHLPSYAYDTVQQGVHPSPEILDLFHVDALNFSRIFDTDPSCWREQEVIPGYPALYPKNFRVEKQPDGSTHALLPDTGEHIGIMPKGATYFDQLIHPYADGYPADFSNLAADRKRVTWGGLGKSPWDRAGEPNFWQFLREKTIKYKATTNRAIVLSLGCNLFEWGGFMRRLDEFLMDLLAEPQQVHAFLDALMEKHLDGVAKTCAAVGDIVDIIRFGDDLGMTNGPFFSKETYREFFKPRQKILCDHVKKHSTMRTMLHSCGSIHDFIPDLIEAGFDILNPVQINALRMEPERLKKDFGADVTFWGGGCDTSHILPKATPAEVKKHVLRNLEIFAPGGGFVFNTVHNIMPDVPPENILAMFEAVAEFNGDVI